ncbi:LPS-assembly protein LptD [Legionella septentrionalis]|uniref:LPS-assembly protein LptD n=2 Tax=Legionella septentrionalis TaxID=2498109 RepID=A0A3S0X359_9GAMM|nr:LPS-assembly protein LptD [Legionella septentrionalis]
MLLGTTLLAAKIKARFGRLGSVFLINWTAICAYLSLTGVALWLHTGLRAQVNIGSTMAREAVQACVVTRDAPLDSSLRARFAQCLGWQITQESNVCEGYYESLPITPLPENEIYILADEASFYAEGRSQLTGRVEIQETQRIVNAKTAYIFRDPKTNKIQQIELIGEVRYREPDRLMIARRAVINPQDNSGRIEDVLYRFSSSQAGAVLPAWGRASLIERFANRDYLLRQATYTTCAPQDRAWQIEAQEITLDDANATGVARNAVLRVNDWPLLYTPYLTFPTSKQRKSGFLLPIYGYTNVGGFDFGLPYYWNIAPNYDATIIPHVYGRRGLMMGGDFRFLTANSIGTLSAHFLPHDRAFADFLHENSSQFPSLRGQSTDRWTFMVHESTQFTPNLSLGVNYQQVSDDYYLQDFSTNLAILTQNQLLRQGNLTYTTDHWLFYGMLQSYQTLHPVNQSVISDVYERLPQLRAQGIYNELPLNAEVNLLGQFDYFNWPAKNLPQPEGPRFHLNPTIAFPHFKSWGYVTPEAQLVENYYDVHYGAYNTTFNPYSLSYRSYDSPYAYDTTYGAFMPSQNFNRTIPRYDVDGGLFFERFTRVMGQNYTQTLEPRLFYLYVPYHDQTPIPVYDSAYMIFNYDQLFRTNRFSGFDRIGDANQLSYALTSRWLAEDTGKEKASFSIGQIRYFSDRRVQLCYNKQGNCADNPLTLGYLSPVAKSSPIASRAVYRVNPAWMVSGDYVWDVYTHATNNGNLNFHYQPAANQILNFGYSYLVNGDVTQVANSGIQDNALHQANISAALPFTEKWSGLGAYSYNISKHYSMMGFAGLQYDTCCWAVRLLGGRTFRSLTPNTLTPQYTNNVYLQILLKGLGSAASGDPTTIIRSYLPTYADIFRH